MSDRISPRSPGKRSRRAAGSNPRARRPRKPSKSRAPIIIAAVLGVMAIITVVIVISASSSSPAPQGDTIAKKTTKSSTAKWSPPITARKESGAPAPSLPSSALSRKKPSESAPRARPLTKPEPVIPPTRGATSWVKNPTPIPEEAISTEDHASKAPKVKLAQNPPLKVPASASRRTVKIDAAWLRQQRTSPYLLDQAATTYVLMTDVRTLGTAFVVGAADVTLDLNKHSVTYGEVKPITVQNGNFEEGSEKTIPGWDVSKAPTAVLAPNTNYLFDKQVLRLQDFRAPQKIISNPIRIPVAKMPYVATITPANVKSHCRVEMSVVDAKTGQVLGKAKSSSASRGFAPVVHFTAKQAGFVRLVVDVTPLKGADSLDLDRAEITFAGHHGVVAASTWSGNLKSYAEFSPRARSTYKKARRFTIRNGTIQQGQGNAYASPPLYFRGLDGVIVENLETLVTGMDSETLHGTDAKDYVIVRNCTFRAKIDNLSHRMKNFAMISLVDVKADVHVEGNKLLGAPQIGIRVAENPAEKVVTIRKNEIRQNAVVTNGYGIILAGVQNFEVSANHIQPDSGKGISLDSYSKTPISQGRIFDNVVDVQEKPNREYPRGLESVGLRLRNTADRHGPQRNIKIYDNQFTARCGPGFVSQAYGGRISYVNDAGGMNDCGVEVVNNTFKAVALGDDDDYRAKALVIDRLDRGVNVKIAHNILESNDGSLGLGDTSGGAEDVKIVSCTFRKSEEKGPRPYHAILSGYWGRELDHVHLVDPRFAAGATPDVEWIGTGKKELLFGKSLQVKVQDRAGNPISGAQLELRDGSKHVWATSKTNTEGIAENLTLMQWVLRQRGKDKQKIERASVGPFSLMVNHNGKSVLHRVTQVPKDGVLTLTLDH